MHSVLWRCWLGDRKGIRPVKNMGGWWRWALVSPDGVAPSRMVYVSASVNLPLHHKVQKFSSGTSSPGRSQKKSRKTVVVVVLYYYHLLFLCNSLLCLSSVKTFLHILIFTSCSNFFDKTDHIEILRFCLCKRQATITRSALRDWGLWRQYVAAGRWKPRLLHGSHTRCQQAESVLAWLAACWWAWAVYACHRALESSMAQTDGWHRQTLPIISIW